jgi:chitodextrinase
MTERKFYAAMRLARERGSTNQVMRLKQTCQISTVLVFALTWSGTAYAQSTACDLDNSGTTNVVDVTRAVNMALGTAPCTANVEGPQVCTVVTVQRIVNAALGQPCVTYNQSTHSVTLNWSASSSSGVTGYNVYRRVGTTGSYTKINTAVVTALTFSDSSIALSTTYQYAVSAVDNAGNESALSNPATAVIPGS